MEISNEQIFEGALALPPEQRALLIDRLLESLAANQPECRPAWIAEIRRRIDDFRSDRTHSISADEASDRVRRAIDRTTHDSLGIQSEYPKGVA